MSRKQVEAGFITTPQDLARLTNPKFQGQFGLALAKAIKAFLMANPPQGSYFAQAYVKT
jgi:N-acetylmuramoyl-L-alanine amidase